MSHYPFTVGKDWEFARSQSDPWSPMPFISCQETKFGEIFLLLKKVFCKLRKTGVVRWQIARELQVLRAGFKEMTFKGKWNEREIYEWLKRATIARCELLTNEMYELLSEKGKPIVHFFIDPQKNREEWLAYVQLFPPHQYSYLPYEAENKFVTKFHAKDKELPIVIYYNPRTKFQAFYEGEMDYQELGDWIAEVGSKPELNKRFRQQQSQSQLKGSSIYGAVGIVVLSAVIVAVMSPNNKFTSLAAFWP
jgi:hypothetical protein